jgi:hypothetical protein
MRVSGSSGPAQLANHNHLKWKMERPSAAILKRNAKMRRLSISLLALLIAMTVSVMVIAANRKSSDFSQRLGGIPASWNNLLF